MSSFTLFDAFSSLKSYCEDENFLGWDPYDGLNSKIFQATPFKKWNLARLIWIQGFKRSPINFRPLLMVPKEHNAKGVGLLLNGYCNLFRLADQGITDFGARENHLEQINHLAQLLVQLKTDNYSGACWGYNFDWQARRLFFFPKNTPNVVVTSFVATALFEAYEITGESEYLEIALSSALFFIKDLHRTPTENGMILSYSPLSGNNTVYNASLLGAKALSYCYHYSKILEYKETAESIVRAACAGQRKDGSWIYGLLPIQSWVDSFHTGYNIDCLAHYKALCQDDSYDENIHKGVNYYLSNFFLEDGTPKYYNNKKYPIDIKCPAQLWITLSVLKKWRENKELSENILCWTLTNMQNKKGFFYYQIRGIWSSKISYMRWSNAFMFNALTYYIKESYGK